MSEQVSWQYFPTLLLASLEKGLEQGIFWCGHDTILRGTLGFAVLQFWPFFTSVFQSFRFWSLVLRFSTALRFAVVSPFCRRFRVCRCCSKFFGSFITHTLHAALECYTDIAVSVFNGFGHWFAVFGAFCCGFAVFATLQCPPQYQYPCYICMGVCCN